MAEGKPNANQPRLDMPHSTEAEQAVLGSMLSSNDVAFSISNILCVDDFYSPAHKAIFGGMQNIINRSKPVDFVTVVDELSTSGSLAQAGDIDYLSSISSAVPSVENFEYYVQIVKRDSVLRRLILAGQNIIKNARSSDDEQNCLAFAEKEVFDISQKEDKSSLVKIAGATEEVIKKLDEIAKNGQPIRGIPTGINALDDIINGLHNSDLVLLAARPGFGKTSLAMNMVLNAALNHQKKCAVFSLEMSSTQLAQRAIFSIAGVSMEKGLRGKLTSDELKRVWAAKSAIAQSELYIDHSSLTTPADVLSKCRRLKREHGLDLVMIDYLQLMTAGGKSREENRQQEVAQITRFLKVAARELDVPILLLSQLSRATEGRKDHKPMLSDLRESGSIEQDADIVMFIYKPDMYNDITNEDGVGICEIMVAKHRNGRIANAKVRWIGECTKFVDVSDKTYSAISRPTQQEQDVPATLEETDDGEDIW